MLFWLKKVAGFWLMPLPFSLALIVIGAVLLRFTRRQTAGRGLVLAGGLWLLACSNSGVGTWLVRGLETEFPSQPALKSEDALPPALARCRFVVVLGGGHSYVPDWPATNQLSPSALSRIVEGVRLARQMPAARLIVSGPADEHDGGPSHARMLADAAVSLGIPRERILEISSARDTEEEAAAIRSITQGAPLALVTSAWHLPRAMALCRRQGLDALACPADYAARTSGLKPGDFLAWNVGGLERSTKALYEFIGVSWSRLRGKA
ncbi:MAG TPA: ElyC/SanA/YdcF family protein [Rariglobus sp.]